jgi:GNAT superfamily N-acetyltransferase
VQTTYMKDLPEGGRPAIADLVHQPGTACGREVYLITRINVPERARGYGYGSMLLRRICEQANNEGVVLQVHPIPSGGLNMTQLLRWYRRYGFEGHAGVPMIRYPGQWVPGPRTLEEQTAPSCVGCGDSGPLAGLEPLLAGNPTEGSTVVGYCCVDCAERFRKLVLTRYPSLMASLRDMRSIDVVNRPSRTLGRE